MAKLMQSRGLPVAPLDAELEAYLDALDDQRLLAASVDDDEVTFSEIMQMVAGRRAIPFCPRLSVATAVRLHCDLPLAA